MRTISVLQPEPQVLNATDIGSYALVLDRRTTYELAAIA
jgi:hypothetical protein